MRSSTAQSQADTWAYRSRLACLALAHQSVPARPSVLAQLMLGYAHGDAIDMQGTLETFPIRLTTVEAYARRALGK